MLLTACKPNEQKVDLRVENGYIQYTTNGTTWQNLIDVDDIKGEQGIQGPQGDPGTAVNGREVEFDTTSTHIVWRYKGETEWQELVLLSTLKGEPGTGVKGDNGFTPYIEDGYWYINEESTGVKAEGTKGDKGNGIKTITPSIDSDKTNALQTTV